MQHTHRIFVSLPVDAVPAADGMERFNKPVCVTSIIPRLVLPPIILYGISEIATTKSLVVASSVWVLPRRLLLVGVIPNPQDQHDVLAA